MVFYFVKNFVYLHICLFVQVTVYARNTGKNKMGTFQVQHSNRSEPFSLPFPFPVVAILSIFLEYPRWDVPRYLEAIGIPFEVGYYPLEPRVHGANLLKQILLKELRKPSMHV